MPGICDEESVSVNTNDEPVAPTSRGEAAVTVVAGSALVPSAVNSPPEVTHALPASVIWRLDGISVSGRCTADPPARGTRYSTGLLPSALLPTYAKYAGDIAMVALAFAPATSTRVPGWA